MNTKGISRHLNIKLTYANVIATLALFLALGGGAVAATHLGRASVGTAQLKAGAVTGTKVKDGSLTGADIVASTLGKVPAAGHADAATSADRATTAGRADSAAHADTAGSAGVASSLTEPEAVHFLGDPGEPGYGTVAEVESVGFYLDHEGVIHLQGQVAPQSELPVLATTLPPGYRPGKLEVFFGVAAKAGVSVRVYSSGVVEISGAAKGETVSLSGLTWRAYNGPLA